MWGRTRDLFADVGDGAEDGVRGIEYLSFRLRALAARAARILR